VAAVSSDYEYTTQYSPAQPNGVYVIINTEKWLTVSDREGGNGLDFRSAQDPRVPTAFVDKEATASPTSTPSRGTRPCRRRSCWRVGWRRG